MKDISTIIARKLLKSTGKEEQETLRNWENRSQENSSFSNQFQEYWNNPADEIQYSRLEQVRHRLFARINATKKTRKDHSTLFYLSRVAAAVILIVSVSALSIYFANQTKVFDSNNWVQVSTDVGQRSQLTLPDGSHVWLNVDTDIKYSAGKKSRKVRLSGEAYFEVEHASDYPFIVETGNGKIEVLGTKFNVAHYKNSEITEASLLSGKITMKLPAGNKELEIKPGERITYNIKKKSYTKESVDVLKDISWKQGVLVFKNELFSEMIFKLEKYYGVNVNYNKADFKDIHYTGTIDNLNINSVFEFINLTIPINYEMNNKQINLSRKK